MIRIKSTIVTVIVCLSLMSTVYAKDAADDVIRLEQGTSGKITDWMGITFNILEDFKDNASDFKYSETDIGLNFKTPIDWFVVSINYTQIFKTLDKENWESENRPNLNLQVKGTLFLFDISNKIRTSYRDTQDWDDWEVRNIFVLSFNKYAIKPFFKDELYYDFHRDEFSTNKAYFGTTFPIYGIVYGRIDYAYVISKSDVDDDWEHTGNQYGFKINFKF